MEHTYDPLNLVIAQFSELETQLISFMEYVPLIKENQNIISPKLPGILVEACSLTESVFRHYLDDKNTHTNFKKYSEECENGLALEAATTIFLSSPIKLIHPFQGWTSKTPCWWAAYNKIKHDRIDSFSEASFINTVLSVAALHQVIARSRLFISQMVKTGWFNESDEEFLEMGVARIAGAGPPSIPVESKLFVTALKDNFVVEEDGVSRIDYQGFSEHVKSLIWEYEEWDCYEKW